MCLAFPTDCRDFGSDNALAIVDVSRKREINLVCVISEDHPIELRRDWCLFMSASP